MESSAGDNTNKAHEPPDDVEGFQENDEALGWLSAIVWGAGCGAAAGIFSGVPHWAWFVIVPGIFISGLVSWPTVAVARLLGRRTSKGSRGRKRAGILVNAMAFGIPFFSPLVLAFLLGGDLRFL